jgi:hypothetical protein
MENLADNRDLGIGGTVRDYRDAVREDYRNVWTTRFQKNGDWLRPGSIGRCLSPVFRPAG